MSIELLEICLIIVGIINIALTVSVFIITSNTSKMVNQQETINRKLNEILKQQQNSLYLEVLKDQKQDNNNSSSQKKV